MDVSSRQSEILGQLEKMRKEIARKERKLQKLKRLSAQKRSYDSAENSSTAVEDTRLLASLGVRSPLRPLETTLSQSEICQSKPLRRIDSQGKNINLRETEVDLWETDESACERRSHVDRTRTEIGEREAAASAQDGEVKPCGASACERVSPSDALPGPSKGEQKHPSRADDCRYSSVERSPAETSRDSRVQLTSHFSPYLVSPVHSAPTSVTEASVDPISAGFSSGKELCSGTSLNISKREGVAVLSTAECFPAAFGPSNLRGGVNQHENQSVGLFQQNEEDGKHTARSSHVSIIGGRRSCKQSCVTSADVAMPIVQCHEKQSIVQNDVQLLPIPDRESLHDEHVDNSQKEMFEEQEVYLDSQDNRDTVTVTEEPATESTEMTEPQWQTTETSDSLSSKSWSPKRKRRRTMCKPPALSAAAETKSYNFRQRRLSHSPPVMRPMSREAKNILGAFQRLIQQARQLPVSTFQLQFEKLGLHQYWDAKGMPGQANPQRLENGFCGRLLSEECCDETAVRTGAEQVKGRMNTDSPSVLQTPTSSRRFESASVALSLLPDKGNGVPQNATDCDKRETRRSRRQKGQSSVSSGSAQLESIASSTVAPGGRSSRKGRSMPGIVVRSVSNMTDDCSQATDAEPKESSPVCEHTTPNVQLPEVARFPGGRTASRTVDQCFRKQCEKIETPVSSTVVCEVAALPEEVEQSSMHVHTSREVSGVSVSTAINSFEITAVEVQKRTVVEMCLHDVGSASRNLITSPQESGNHVHLVDKQNSCRTTRKVFTALTRVLDGKDECSSQELDRNGRQLENIRCTMSSTRSDVCEPVNGQGSECSDGEDALAATSPAHSNLFTQSEESDSAGGEINEFVTTVVAQLNARTSGAADHRNVDQPQDSQASQSDSATPDNIDLPESLTPELAGTPRHLSPSHGHQGLLTEAEKGGLDSKEEGLGHVADNPKNAEFSSSLRASSKASDLPSGFAELASSTCAPSSGLPGKKGIGSGTEATDLHSHRSPILSAAEARKAEEQTATCLPGAVSKCVAKKLFADASVGKKASASNADLSALLDPQVLEGMFDEWSEDLDSAARPVNAADTDNNGSRSQNCVIAIQKEHLVNEASAAAGGCRNSSACHTPVQITCSELGRWQTAGGLPQSLQIHQSGDKCSADSEHTDGQNHSQGTEDAEEAECGSPDPALRDSIEAERKLPSEDQCSQSVSNSLEALSGMSRFSDEAEERGVVPSPEGDQQLGCGDLSSPVRSDGKYDGLSEEDHDGAGWDNTGVAYEEPDQMTTCHRGSLLGTGNPLLFFCELKCEQEQPITSVHLVQAVTHPFLVSVQASAINVWHLEQHGWQHSLVMRKLKFSVEEDHCLLSCDQWTVLVYLSARTPMHLPCLEWNTHNGQDGSQLLLTLGSLGSADGFSLKRSQRIYRIAKLSREGWFATALRTTGGATLLRIHRLCHVHGELGDETDLLGRTSSALDSLISIEGQCDALLGNSANIFYVWDCNERVLVKKMIHEPDVFGDLQHISWCCSDRGLLFVLMQSFGDVATTLVAMNPFSCKAEAFSSLSWKLATKAQAGGSRSCSIRVEGRYMACVAPGYGVRIWNIFTGNPVANMWYRSSTSVTMTELSGSMVAAVGLDDGRVLVFNS
ncbi:uncharacterized protein [Dermacentor albipictus]|uniref:uncharacterized protein n=1 Tax=Dermacentor albipictus TaxID=60249 RepID=UPI0038FC7021